MSYQSIIQAESRYNNLLPVSRLTKSPGIDLMSAARSWSDIIWDTAVAAGALSLTDEQVNRGRELIRHPIFVCGVHRSGTTLLRDLLDSHPDLVVLPSEGTFYTNLEHKITGLSPQDKKSFMAKEWLRRLANPINQSPYWLLGRSSEQHSPYVDFARYVLSWWDVVDDDGLAPHHAIVLAYALCVNSLSSKMWVDKTPTNERFLQRINMEYPGAKIIHMVRDPVDILSSRKKLDPHFHMRQVLGGLRLSFQVAVQQQLKYDQNYLLMHYEKLCDDPSIVTKQLIDFLGIENSATLSQPTAAGIATMANSSFQKESTAGAIHKWARLKGEGVLSGEEKQLLSLFVGGLAQRLGYGMEMPGFFVRVYLWVRYLKYFLFF